MLFDALKVYGKEAAQLESVSKLMRFALAEYSWQAIREAFAYHVKNSSEFPTPADIVQIIERGNKPPFERSVYTAISKKLPEDRDSDEWSYMRGYENWILRG